MQGTHQTDGTHNTKVDDGVSLCDISLYTTGLKLADSRSKNRNSFAFFKPSQAANGLNRLSVTNCRTLRSAIPFSAHLETQRTRGQDSQRPKDNMVEDKQPILQSLIIPPTFKLITRPKQWFKWVRRPFTKYPEINKGSMVPVKRNGDHQKFER